MAGQATLSEFIADVMVFWEPDFCDLHDSDSCQLWERSFFELSKALCPPPPTPPFPLGGPPTPRPGMDGCHAKRPSWLGWWLKAMEVKAGREEGRGPASAQAIALDLDLKHPQSCQLPCFYFTYCCKHNPPLPPLAACACLRYQHFCSIF